ncbi:hypothetical protein LIER_22833 [Lithospermum erythrorhizon]|uniref:Reverse transcriptase Ty1/copia-type domain-containing protein n=1 Tax=Lithospermum erythrorhizon TaxID=34254 RepID=A0AAV3QXS8_LITER
MDVKSAFLNVVVEEEVYVEQPKGFLDNSCPQHDYRLKKALYGLKQAPRACMSDQLVQQFVQQMKPKFEMSMVGELIKKFGLENSKSKRTPAATHIKVAKDVNGSLVNINPKESHLNQVKRIIKYVNGTVEYGLLYTFDINSTLVGFCDVDWVGNAEDGKITSGGCFFVGNNLVSWFSKKQNSVSLSIVEVEYIDASSCCTQLLWMKTNHIDIRHHFIRELVEDKVITLEHVSTDKELANIFTKTLDAAQFESLRSSLGLCVIDK